MPNPPTVDTSEDRDGGAMRYRQNEGGIPLELPTAVEAPCSECPWRREAAPGWLGPNTAEEWVEAAHGEQPIMCHKTCNPEGDYEGTRQCRGAAIFRANVVKKLRRADGAHGPVDHERVFSSNAEFIAHHNRSD